MNEYLEPGSYEIKVTLYSRYTIEEGDRQTERDLANACRKRGTMVNWEVRDE